MFFSSETWLLSTELPPPIVRKWSSARARCVVSSRNVPRMRRVQTFIAPQFIVKLQGEDNGQYPSQLKASRVCFLPLAPQECEHEFAPPTALEPYVFDKVRLLPKPQAPEER